MLTKTTPGITSSAAHTGPAQQGQATIGKVVSQPSHNSSLVVGTDHFSKPNEDAAQSAKGPKAPPCKTEIASALTTPQSTSLFSPPHGAKSGKFKFTSRFVPESLDQAFESHGAGRVSATNAKPILAVDGGGIRGIIPATILAEIEKRTAKPISSLFKVISGTSTGGIISLGLVKPKDGTTNPQFSAQDLVQLYESKGTTIFPDRVLNKARTLDGLRGPVYPVTGLEKTLDDFFGTTPMSSSLTKVVIPTFDIENYRQWYIRNPDFFLMKEAARATSAAPTYFEPAHYVKGQQSFTFLDGGMFDNNPASTALEEARQLYGASGQYLVLSLGTGVAKAPATYDEAKKWGLVHWARTAPNILLYGNSCRVDEVMQEELPSNLYYRFQCDILSSHEAMDDASSGNVAYLKEQAQALIDEHEDSLDQLVRQLTAGGDGEV